MNGQRPMLGQARTVRWAPVRKPHVIHDPMPSTWEDVKDFLLPEVKDARGLVYVAGVEDGLQRDLALAGGFSCEQFDRVGFEGVILGGAVRDAHVVTRIARMPIWASNYTPADTQGNYRVVETGNACRIESVTIHDGDWIFADESGAVVVPANVWSEVVHKALETEEIEDRITARIAKGEDLYDIVRRDGRL